VFFSFVFFFVFFFFVFFVLLALGLHEFLRVGVGWGFVMLWWGGCRGQC
jgi:hypothetical protein